MRLDRDRVQLAVRLGALGFVVAWLFAPALQTRIPWWLAFVILAATELEFVARARTGATDAPSTPTRRPPGAEDADLGWGELVEVDEEVHWAPPPPRRPRPRGRLWIGLATAVVGLALLVVAARTDAQQSWNDLDREARSRTEAAATVEAARIAERPVQIECDVTYTFTGARSDALGVAVVARGVAYLHPSICRGIHDVLDDPTGVGESDAEAIEVLAHEAMHLRGVRNEGVTECFALQEGVELGRRLGLSPADSARLMRARYAAALSERNVVRAAYALPRGCEDGGEYDLRPTDSSFP